MHPAMQAGRQLANTCVEYADGANPDGWARHVHIPVILAMRTVAPSPLLHPATLYPLHNGSHRAAARGASAIDGFAAWGNGIRRGA